MVERPKVGKRKEPVCVLTELGKGFGIANAGSSKFAQACSRENIVSIPEACGPYKEILYGKLCVIIRQNLIGI